MSKEWYPVIDYDTCSECGACIEKCTHGVYDKALSRPTVIYPDGCITNCRGCQKLCPSGALSYFGDMGQAPSICCSD